MIFKAILVGLFLLTASAPLPELDAREVNIDCTATTCTIKKEDLEYMLKRDHALTQLVVKLSDLAKACNFKDI